MTHEEFESRVTSRRGYLFTVARSILPPDDCEDAVQGAILSAWANLTQLRDDARFDAWLTQILRNQCYQILREKKNRLSTAEALKEADMPFPEEIGLHEALKSLSKEDQHLLLMHHDRGYSLKEMSETMGESKEVLKMRLFRARQRLRIALISLLLTLLLIAAAAGSGYLDVNWFLKNRRASQQPAYDSDSRSVSSFSYSGRLLQFEVSDAKWDLETLRLLFTYSLTGVSDDTLTVHSGNIGVDGKRHDHIWVDGQILPVSEWADGKMVYTYSLDGWRLDGRYFNGSEDYLVDGKGEAFFAEFWFDQIAPDVCDTLSLECDVVVRSYATHETIEEGTLEVNLKGPDAEEWRAAYEEYHR